MNISKPYEVAPHHTAWAPWYVARSDDKRRARLNIITHLLSKVSYKKVSREKVKLPKRRRAKKISLPTTRSSSSPKPIDGGI
jgi:hypothetical protein